MAEKWVYLYSELEDAEARVDDWEGVRSLLGGKGANLAEMSRIGVPVPPGFTVTTEACIAYLAADGRFPPEIWEQQLTALRSIEKETGKEFGNPDKPLLVSCRSGAKFSMPGMMDTILNLGMNDEVAEGMVKLTGDPRFVYDAYRRLIQMFGTVVREMEDDVFEEVIEQRRQEAGVATDPEMGAEDWKALTQRFKELVKIHTRAPFPQDPVEQLKAATEAVFESWNTKRAMDYRNASHIPHHLGTAVNIVTMVFGNMGETSGTGVVMSRNPTGALSFLSPLLDSHPLEETPLRHREEERAARRAKYKRQGDDRKGSLVVLSAHLSLPVNPSTTPATIKPRAINLALVMEPRSS
jgi:pyruvate,orthophosphate dikinase